MKKMLYDAVGISGLFTVQYKQQNIGEMSLRI